MDLLGAYDSPTFLGQKDRYMMGLSLPELIIAMVIAGGWFLVTLALPGAFSCGCWWSYL